VPTLGDVRLADRDGGEILLEVGGTTTGPQSGPNNATFESAYTVTKGTGQFSNVKGGSGDAAAFELTDPGTGKTRPSWRSSTGPRGAPADRGGRNTGTDDSQSGFGDRD
jgi:hypothetical protein